MSKKTDLQKISTNLQGLFGSRNWHLLWQTYKLVEHWPEMAGRTIASKSMPAYIQKNILWIYVSDSIWMQHLHAQKIQLLERIHDFDNNLTIEDIRWLLQPKHKEIKEKKSIGKTTEIDPEEKKHFAEIASSIKDEQCRNALCRLWQIYHENK